MKRKGFVLVVLTLLVLFVAVSCKEEPEPVYKGTFYGWNSKEPGSWVKTETRIANSEYDLEFRFNKGNLQLLVDGAEIYEYQLKKDDNLVTATKVKNIILQSLNNGTEYTVQWTIPTLDGTAVSPVDWVTDRTTPKTFEIKNGKATLTTTDADVTDYYRFQGKTLDPSMTEASQSWSVKTRVSFDASLLDVKGFAPSVWLLVQDGEGNDIDYSIIELRSDAQ